MADFYADPVVYDILHTPGTAEEVDVLERIAGRYAPTAALHPTWLEPACGSGRYLRVLEGRGIRAIGFDTSADMIAYASRRLERAGLARSGQLLVADMTSFAPHVGAGRIDFAFNLINTIRHLPSDRAMLCHFEQISRVLQPSGVYAVGISFSRYGEESPSEDEWRGTRGRCAVEEVVRYEPPTGRSRRERVVHRVAVRRPRGVERRRSTYYLRCYDERQWDRLLGRSPLERIAGVDEWGAPLDDESLLYQIELLRRRPPSPG